MAQEPSGGQPVERKRSSRSRSVVLALAVVTTLAGAGMWVYAAATRDNAAPTPTPSAGLGGAPSSSLVSGFAGQETMNGAATEGTQQAGRLIDEASPAVVRFGVSGLAGFALGYTLRRFIKAGLLLTGIALVGVYAAHRAGLITGIEASELEEGAERAAEWARSEAGAVRKFVTGLVPSGFAAAVGAFFGFRR